MNKEENGNARKARTYLVNGHTVSAETNEISVGDQINRIEPKSMEVLVYLFDHAGQVVSRDQLQDAIWGDVIVGDDSLTNAIIKIRRAFGDDARAPKVIETIPKRGYRLIADVTEAPVNSNPLAEVKVPRWAALAALLTVFSVLGFWVFGEKPDVVAPVTISQDNRTRIAVAPFLNLSNDPSQQYLVSGIEQTILTSLAANPQLVAMRYTQGSTSSQYRLEGSVQRNGDRIRVDTRLLSSTDGSVLAAQRYDRDFSDLIAIETDIETTIVRALSLDIDQANLAKQSLGYTKSVIAYDLFLQAQAALLQRDQSGNIAARELYLQAIERDPRFARAYAGLALAHAADYRNNWAQDGPTTLEQALSLASAALEIQPDLPEQYWVIGYVRTQQRQLEQGEDALNNALRLDPDYADAFALLGGIKTYAGEPKETLPLMHQAMRLNPDAGHLYFLLLGRAYYFLNDCPIALINLAESASRNPTNLETRLYIAACHAQMGNPEDAQWEMEEILGIESNFTLEAFFEAYPMVSADQIKMLTTDLRSAGAQ